MSMFKSTFEHRDFYNKFIEHYNESERKITAVSEIRANCAELRDQEKRMMDEVSENYQELKDISKKSHLPYSETFSEKNKGSEHPDDKDLHFAREVQKEKAMKKVLRELDEQITNEDHINFSDETLGKLIKIIKRSFDHESTAYYPASEFIKKAKKICEIGALTDKYRGKQRHLNKLLHRAINDDYPAELEKWEQLSDEEQQDLHGVALKKRELKEKDYAKLMPTVVKIAVDIIDDKGNTLSHYITKSNDIRAKLYSNILMKLPEEVKDRLEKDRLRSWLRKDLRSGELKKLIEAERKKR